MNVILCYPKYVVCFPILYVKSYYQSNQYRSSSSNLVYIRAFCRKDLTQTEKEQCVVFNTCVKHAVAFCVKYYECFKVCVVRNDIVIFTWNMLSAM